MKFKPYQNNLKNKEIRKNLRKETTEAEKNLWQKLRNKGLGAKFRRQFGIKNYIVDFYCHKKGVIIEVDGFIHAENNVAKKDNNRQKELEELGFKVLRYRNEQVLYESESVLQDILNNLNKL
jgi:very-short-patch-repair endonuclease